MSTESIVQKQTPVVSHINPFARALEGHVNAGTVAVESERAIAEAQGKLVIAKRFPRDQARAYVNIIEACKRPGLAEEACYSFPRGGEVVSGPAIRLAEMLAANWGNVDYGIRELSRKEGVSEMEAYCWDLETNTMSSQKFTVRHIRDTRGGAKPLTDERDIYELTANMGARRLRARILAILPADLVQAAVDQCSKTLANGADVPMADRIRQMLAAFKTLGVPAALIEKRLGHSLDNLTGEELADLRKIHNSLRDNMSKLSDWFGDGQKQEDDVPYTETPAQTEPEQRKAPPKKSTKGAAAVAENPAPKTEAAPPAEAKTTEPAKEAPKAAETTPAPEPAKTVAAEIKAEKAAEKTEAATPAPEPKVEKRAFLKDAEEITVPCVVVDVQTLIANLAGVATPTVQATVRGGFNGMIYDFGGATQEGDVLTAKPAWKAGKELTLTLLGKLNQKSGKVLVRATKVEEAKSASPAAMEVE
jgi:hypothetical protein